MERFGLLASFVACLSLLVACDGGGGAAEPSTTRPTPSTAAAPPTSSTTTTTAPAPSDGDISAVSARLVEVATVEAPTDIAFRPGDPDAMYVAERPGRIRVVRDGEVAAAPALDLTEDTSTEGERGLLGIAFSPDGDRLYVHHSGGDGHNRLVEYAVAVDGSIDAGSRRQLLVVEQDSPVHKAGDLDVDREGLLYVALGDGGPPGDPNDHAQDLADLRGSILRLDPTPDPGGAPYTVPPDNPFVGQEGPRPEIWVYGLRNPWRISLDLPTGDLWIGDVGQYIWEEIDRLPAGEQAGANLGWNRFEGRHRFAEASGPPPDNHVGPLHEYNHDDGSCAVTGGHVYRGSAVAGLAGAYLFTDVCDGRIRALTHDGERVLDVRVIAEGPSQLVTFGRDLAGELYVATLDGRIFRLSPG